VQRARIGHFRALMAQHVIGGGRQGLLPFRVAFADTIGRGEGGEVAGENSGASHQQKADEVPSPHGIPPSTRAKDQFVSVRQKLRNRAAKVPLSYSHTENKSWTRTGSTARPTRPRARSRKRPAR